MKNRFLQMAYVSGLIMLAWLIFLMAGGFTGTNITEKLLQPWLAFCAWVTPFDMQFSGNIPLGLSWVISGMMIYSLITGATIVSLWGVMNQIKRTETIDA